MSYINIRDSIVAAVKALTPETLRGAKRFVEFDGPIELAETDRNFALKLTDGPSVTGGMLTLINWRYTTGIELGMFFSKMPTLRSLEQKISEDVSAVQRAVCDPENLGTDNAGLVPRGEEYFTSVIEAYQDGAIVRISFSVQHR